MVKSFSSSHRAGFFIKQQINFHLICLFSLHLEKLRSLSYIFVIYVCARARTHSQASKQASKPFRCRGGVLRLFFSSPTITSSLSFFLTYTITCCTHRKGSYCASRTFACLRARFLCTFCCCCNHHTPLHTRQTETNIHTCRAKQSSLHTHTHTRPLQRVRFIFKKTSETRKQRHTDAHIHMHAYIEIRHVCVCARARVFSRCRFFLLEPGSKEKQHHWLTGSHFSPSLSLLLSSPLSVCRFLSRSLSLCLTSLFIHSFGSLYLEKRGREREKERSDRTQSIDTVHSVR